MSDVTPLEAAQTLGVTRTRIYALISSGAIRAWQDDGKWRIDAASVEGYRRNRRKRGRPRKEA